MKVISFDAWKEARLKALSEEDDPLCPECDGSGECDCDMGYTHECKSCDGTGVGDGVPVTQQDYEQQVMSDVVMLAEWVGNWRNAYWPDINIKYHPFCWIDTRGLSFAQYGVVPWRMPDLKVATS